MAFNSKLSFKRAASAVLDLFYPPLCLHCKELLPSRGPVFCGTCLELLSLAEAKGRCRTCFRELQKDGCGRCRKRRTLVHRQLAACEPAGPALSLLRGIDNGKWECIPAAASLMAYQWMEQQMLLPEIIIPVPCSFSQKQKNGFDGPLSLAKELGKIFGVPVVSLLKRKFDRSHFLTQGEFRCEMGVKEKKTGVLCDKRILIAGPQLDDEVAQSAGKELKRFFPTQIDVLAFAAKFE